MQLDEKAVRNNHVTIVVAEGKVTLEEHGQRYAIIVHGVGLSIGSHEGWSPTYLRLLDELLDQVDVVWHSEHLAYTKVDGEHLGIMLALPKTRGVLDMFAKGYAPFKTATSSRRRIPAGDERAS